MRATTAVAVFSIVLLIAACAGQRSEPATAPAGLRAVKAAGLDEVFAAPTANLNRYQRIYIEPVEIRYDPSRRRDGLQRGVDAFKLSERQRGILQQQYERALAQAWAEQPGWEQVAQPDAGVLTLRTELREYYLYASLQDQEPQPSQTLAGESSRFTLAVQLLDADTGALLLQSSDRRVTGDRGGSPENLRPFSAVRYWSEFYRDARHWARQLGSTIETSGPQR